LIWIPSLSWPQRYFPKKRQKIEMKGQDKGMGIEIIPSFTAFDLLKG
jgi:hypothetical protein